MMSEGKYSDRTKFPFPTLLIVDLNMEDGDGFDVLEFIQANPGWHVLPRVVFSSSDDDDIRTAYFLGARSYHCKPSTSSALDKRLRVIVDYWASAEVPPVDQNGRGQATNSMGRRGARYPQAASEPKMKRPVPQAGIGAGEKNVVSELGPASSSPRLLTAGGFP